MTIAAFGTSANSSISTDVVYNTITDEPIAIVAPLHDRKMQA
jgi:hypothetical protein